MKEEKEENKGWIKIHRSITEWEWYYDEKVFKLFVHILLNANIEEKNWEFGNIVVKRGQWATSFVKISKELDVPLQSVRNMVEKLKESGELEVETTPKFTVFTIVNFDKYQLSVEDVEPKEKVETPTPSKKDTEINKAEQNKIDSIIEDVYNHMSKKMKGKKFSVSAKYSKHIRARIKDYKFEDGDILKAVFDHRFSEWSKDNFMKKYLRPETLFNAEKFSIYLDKLEGSIFANSQKLTVGKEVTLDDIAEFGEMDYIWCDEVITDKGREKGFVNTRNESCLVKTMRRMIRDGEIIYLFRSLDGKG